MPISKDWLRRLNEAVEKARIMEEGQMKAPTPEQLNDPEWWDANDPLGGCNRLFLVWEDGCLKRIQWVRGAAMFNREGSMEVPELHHRPTKPAAPEWGGKGLPPVGCEIEICFNDGGSGWWQRALVIAHDAKKAVVRVGDCYYGRSNSNSTLMRPIRTKEQRERDGLANLIRDHEERKGSFCTPENTAELIIAAGWRKGE